MESSGAVRKRHQESLSCVQLERVASVSFLESSSIRARGQFEDGWVGIYVSREGLCFREAAQLCGTRWHAHQLFVGEDVHRNTQSPLLAMMVDVCWRQKGESWQLHQQTQCFVRDEPSYAFFWRFVVYLLPSERCFSQTFSSKNQKLTK